MIFCMQNSFNLSKIFFSFREKMPQCKVCAQDILRKNKAPLNPPNPFTLRSNVLKQKRWLFQCLKALPTLVWTGNPSVGYWRNWNRDAREEAILFNECLAHVTAGKANKFNFSTSLRRQRGDNKASSMALRRHKILCLGPLSCWQPFIQLTISKAK